MSQKKGILNVAFRRGKIFKRFKESERFVGLGVSQSTVYFKKTSKFWRII